MKKLIIALSFVLGLAICHAQINPTNNQFEILKNLEIFSSIYKEIHLHYVDEVKSGELIKVAIDEMLRTLDPYTVYIPEANIEDYKVMMFGQYGGIGTLVNYRNGEVYIADPYEGFPADKAGLSSGDKIKEINGQSCKDRSAEEVSKMLRGQAGTELKLTVEKFGTKEIKTPTLIRQEIKIDNITYSGMLKDDIGYIRLDGFTQGASKEVKEAFAKLSSEGAEKLIIDLRYNGGGLMNEAVQIVNLFYNKGVAVVSTKGKHPEQNHTYKTTEDPIDTKIPIVFLISGGSASASEILAGAMQDYDRAVVVGQNSFGKGLVQNVLPLDYNSQLKVTIAKYYIPSGRCVQALDYGNKDKEGKATTVADSLRKRFLTKGGREVYDGHGIEPDVKIEEKTMSNAAIGLITKFIIFDFANEYKLKHARIDSVKNFQISDDLYGEFIQYVQGKDYHYETNTERLLKKLITSAKEENYHAEIQTEIDALKLKLIASKNEDLTKFQQEIKQLLREEIVQRYYHQKGQAEAALDNDESVLKSIEILNNPAEYQKILLPKKSQFENDSQDK